MMANVDPTVLVGVVGAIGAVVGGGLATLGSWLTAKANSRATTERLLVEAAERELEREERAADRERERRERNSERSAALDDIWRDRRLQAYLDVLDELGRLDDAFSAVYRAHTADEPTRIAMAEQFNHRRLEEVSQRVMLIGSDRAYALATRLYSDLIWSLLKVAAHLRQGGAFDDDDTIDDVKHFDMKLTFWRSDFLNAVRPELGTAAWGGEAKELEDEIEIDE